MFLLGASLLATGLLVAGCEPQEARTCGAKEAVTSGGCCGGAAAAKCPVCDTKAKAGTCCAKCNAVAATPDTVHCTKCNKDFKAGTYCSKCNAYMFNELATCTGCGGQAKKGSWCEKCKAYVGLPGVKGKSCPTQADTTCRPCRRKTSN